jgi:hypothetical protein
MRFSREAFYACSVIIRPARRIVRAVAKGSSIRQAALRFGRDRRLHEHDPAIWAVYAQ